MSQNNEFFSMSQWFFFNLSLQILQVFLKPSLLYSLFSLMLALILSYIHLYMSHFGVLTRGFSCLLSCLRSPNFVLFLYWFIFYFIIIIPAEITLEWGFSRVCLKVCVLLTCSRTSKSFLLIPLLVANEQLCAAVQGLVPCIAKSWQTFLGIVWLSEFSWFWG